MARFNIGVNRECNVIANSVNSATKKIKSRANVSKCGWGEGFD